MKMKTNKIPWCDMYLVKGSELREDEKSKTISDKILGRVLRENRILRQRLADANVGLTPRKRRPGYTIFDKLLKKESE